MNEFFLLRNKRSYCLQQIWQPRSEIHTEPHTGRDDGRRRVSHNNNRNAAFQHLPAERGYFGGVHEEEGDDECVFAVDYEPELSESCGKVCAVPGEGLDTVAAF